MTDVTATPAAADAAKQTKAESPANGTDHRVYVAGTARKVIFSLVFLLLSPFYISLAPMLWARLSQNQWVGTPGLIVLAIAFTLLMGLIVIELMSSIRSKVVIGEKAVRIRLPQARGFTSPFSYSTHDIPYDEIESVEIRREVYGGAVAPVIMKGARVCLKDGRNIKLGYVNEGNVDPAFPFVEIGERIAARANVPIVDLGDVRRSAFKKTFGLHASPQERDVLTAADVAHINTRHSQVLVVLVGILVLLVGVGIASDHDSDIGHASLFSSGGTTSGR